MSSRYNTRYRDFLTNNEDLLPIVSHPDIINLTEPTPEVIDLTVQRPSTPPPQEPPSTPTAPKRGGTHLTRDERKRILIPNAAKLSYSHSIQFALFDNSHIRLP